MQLREASPREHWSSRLAFVLAASGSAVGLGNIWRFPYVVGTNGGAAFVVIYMIVIALIGYPMMVTEMTLGRKTHRNAIGSFLALAPGTPWWLVGAMGVLAGFVILSFYSVVAGWAIAYFFKILTGTLTSGTDFVDAFVNHISHPVTPLIWHAVFMVLTLSIIAAGIAKGIERTVKILMPALLGLLILLALRSLTLPGAGAGIAFYLAPDFSELTAQSLLTAVGQAFFTLSLGMGCMITYGSYLSDGEQVPDNAAWVVGLDTAVALLAGFAVFPAVFALGFDPASGGGLAFITLPAVFAEMPAGTIFGASFFLLLTVAAITSAISLLEVVVAWLVDEFHMDRRRAAVSVGFLIFLLGIPASLSEGVMAEVTFLDTNFFGFLEFLTDFILLPGGGLLTAVFAGHVWSARRTREEANRVPGRIRIGGWFEILLKWVVPAAILVVMITGFLDRFAS